MKLTSYLPFSRSVMQTFLSYGINAFIFMFGSFLRVFLAYYLWMAIFNSSGGDSLQGYNRGEMALYVVIMEFIVRMTGAAEADYWVGEEVRSGAIAMNLIKPISYTGRILAMGFGGLAYELICVFIPMGILVRIAGALWLNMTFPGLAQFAFFMLSILMGFFILFSLNLAFGFLAFHLKNMWGLSNVKFMITYFLSGAMIPLAFFPQWAQPVLRALPFSSIHYIPAQIFLGRLEGMDMYRSLAVQGIWVLVFFGLSQLIYRGAIRHLTVQGG